jgi:hypothetical protein
MRIRGKPRGSKYSGPSKRRGTDNWPAVTPAAVEVRVPCCRQQRKTKCEFLMDFFPSGGNEHHDNSPTSAIHKTTNPAQLGVSAENDQGNKLPIGKLYLTPSDLHWPYPSP